MKKILALSMFITSLCLLSACSGGDTIPPVISVNPDFVATQTLGGMIMIPTATCIDDVDATCYVETTYPTNWVDNLVPGTYTFVFTAEDNAGNVATESVILTLN
ncbi:MAG: hypothetical protein A2Y16_06895 [Tenericutes bacterium GWF2_57_13]|nr:MAG: hypothetical protein A2Y16_06895 [Tenericutes bacterium GWF2_57_13]